MLKIKAKIHAFLMPKFTNLLNSVNFPLIKGTGFGVRN